MRQRILSILLTLLFAPSIISIVVGRFVAPSFLHPVRRPLTQDLVQQADASFASIGVRRESLDVHAADGVLLHGWRVRAAHSNGSWVLLFRGVADNRMGVLEHALVLLRAGYGVTLMDARAHGESEGATAPTVGWSVRTPEPLSTPLLPPNIRRTFLPSANRWARALLCNQQASTHEFRR